MDGQMEGRMDGWLDRCLMNGRMWMEGKREEGKVAG